jgi:hypothetical protein
VFPRFPTPRHRKLHDGAGNASFRAKLSPNRGASLRRIVEAPCAGPRA